MSSLNNLDRDLANYCASRKIDTNTAIPITNKCALSCVNSLYVAQIPPSQRHGLSLTKCRPFRYPVRYNRCH